ncbi:GntR family transcriptional regulator [Aurantimonas sp. A3-2-R12]|uniref:GntR family transcriptional regulator n=1 Tax=Aurantimonas sp. A3-2-R12 TaxID=3114362 RepID=UPI002E1780B3|nr:GntR family transcriptional regulator [Aurantimonas sp. A3-2-R12]
MTELPVEDDIAYPDAPVIQRQTLHKQVAGRIRDLIIEGHLKPGARINEAALVDSLGVSRTPLREALRTLAGEGLIDIRPARGSIVRRLTPEDVFSMLEVLAELEKLAGRLACKRASDKDLAELLAIHDAMMGYYAKRDRLTYYKANQDIHARIARLSRNNMLIDVQANIQARLKRIRFLGNQGPEAWANAVAEHEEMAEALRVRDGARLGEVLTKHLMNTWDRVKDVV